MRYSRRELKAFNFFALFMFGVGGLFFALGAAELAVQPKVQYVISQSRRQADLIREAASTNAPAARRKYANHDDDRVTVEGTNFRGVSNALIGAVFMALSFALNRVLLRVMRHDGEDVKNKPTALRRRK